MREPEILAVLTGETARAGRTATSTPEQLRNRLDAALADGEVSGFHWEAQLLGLEAIDPDTFRIVLTDPRPALALALHLHLVLGRERPGSIRYPGPRLALGVGPLQAAGGQVKLFGRPRERLFRGQGPALDHSLGCLRELRRGRRLLGIRSPWPELNAELEMGLWFLDLHLRRWSPEQAEVILAVLAGQTQSAMALAWGISQPAVAQRFARANGKAVRFLVRRYGKQIGRHMIDDAYALIYKAEEL